MDQIAKPRANTGLLRSGVAALALSLVVGPLLALSQEIRRPLNPGPGSIGENSSADRAFRIAFDAANAGDFDTAAINYGRATLATHDSCDKAHAGAGQTAALEAKALLRSSGTQGKPTQFFWARIQELTKGLPCIWVR
jgi:hypothetical protein